MNDTERLAEIEAHYHADGVLGYGISYSQLSFLLDLVRRKDEEITRKDEVIAGGIKYRADAASIYASEIATLTVRAEAAEAALKLVTTLRDGDIKTTRTVPKFPGLNDMRIDGPTLTR